MATNKVAAKLHRSTHKIVVVLVYALLEWILIMLLLFNSLFYYLIKKFAAFFGLKPTCLWCSSVDSLFESGKKDVSYEGLFCEDHTSQISKVGYSESVKNVSEDGFDKEVSCSCFEKSLRSDPSHLMIKGLLDVASKERVRIEEIEEEEDRDEDGGHGEDCNVSNEEPQILSDVGSFYLQEAAEEDSSRSTSNSLCNEDEEDNHGLAADARIQLFALKAESSEALSYSADHLIDDDKFLDEAGDDGQTIVAETSDFSCRSDLKNQDLDNETSVNEALDDHPEARRINDPAGIIEQLRSELESEHSARKDLSAELEAERSAAAIAANQTMAMITRLQEEKAAIKMEALQYQRMMEEQAEYDQEALQLLNELVIKREKEKQELENELEEYKGKILDYELIKEKARSLRKSGCYSSSSSLNDDSEKLSIDLNREVEEEIEDENKEIPSTGAVLDTVDMVLDRVKNWNMLDGSLEEFEHERLSILNQLKDLEEKLFSICDDDEEEQVLFEDVKPIEVEDTNANLCSAEVNLAPIGCLVELTTEKDHPITMASVAKKLLPFLEDEEGDGEQAGLDTKEIQSDQKTMEVETSEKVLAVMKEMDHVYGRLQALEADREFLRHCIGSLNKGDKGVGLLEEILQHLRELRNADNCELMICNE